MDRLARGLSEILEIIWGRLAFRAQQSPETQGKGKRKGQTLAFTTACPAFFP
jgi:hypothetical protein